MTYEAVADPDGSINTSSIGKTNFWQYSPVLFNAPLTQSKDFRDLGGTRYWTMSIPRAPAPGDVSAGIDFSSDLLHWEPGVTVTNTPFLLEVRDPNPADGQPKRFTRIGASR